MKLKKLLLGFSLVSGIHFSYSADIQVPATSAELVTRDSKPVSCGEFVRTVSIEVFDRYGERAKWAWQAQILDFTPGLTDASGKVNFEAKKVPDKFGRFKTRNPKVTLRFKDLFPTLDGNCVSTSSLANQHFVKSPNQEWKRFGPGCFGDGSQSLKCELIYLLQDLQQMQEIASLSLKSVWTEETKNLYEELEKGKNRDAKLISELLENPKTDVNSRFTGQGSHGYETLWKWYFAKFDVNNVDEKTWMEQFIRRGADIWAKDHRLNTILHHLPSTYGAYAKLQLLDSLVEDTHWLERNAEGESPFARIAANAEEVEILDMLLARTDRDKTLNLVDAYGLTPLGFFEYLHPHHELMPRMKKYQVIYEKLIAAGARLKP